VIRGGDGGGILITRLVIFHSDWSSGPRLYIVLLHWSFLHSLSWLVTDHCRRLTSAFREGSRVICHCFLNRLFRRISSLIQTGIGGHRSSRGPRLGFVSVNAFEIAVNSSLPQASIATPFGVSGLVGSPASRQAWNLDQSVLLKSGWSGGLRKNYGHRVSVSKGE